MQSVAFSPDGKVLVAGARITRGLYVWDVATGAELQSFSGDQSSTRSLAFSPDGRTVATAGGADGQARLFDVATGKQRHTLRDGILSAAAVSVTFASGGTVLVNGHDDGSLRLWDVTTGTRQKVLKVGDSAILMRNQVTAGRDGRLLASGYMMPYPDNKPIIVVWDVVAGTTWTTTAPCKPDALAFSPDGRILAASFMLWEVAVVGE